MKEVYRLENVFKVTIGLIGNVEGSFKSRRCLEQICFKNTREEMLYGARRSEERLNSKVIWQILRMYNASRVCKLIIYFI